MAENGAPSDLSVAQAHAEAEAKEAARIASLPAQPSTDLPQGTAPQGDLEHLAAELAAAMREPEWTPDHLGMTTDVLAAAVAAASAEDDTDPVPVPVQRAEDEAAPASSLDEGSSSEEEGGAGGAPALEPDQQATPKAHAGDATGGPTAGAGPADHDDDTGEASGPLRTAHESAPPTFAEPLQVAVGADCTIQPAGSVLFTQPDQGTVIVQHPGAAAGTPAPLPLAPSGGLAHGASPLRGVLAEVAAGVLEEGSLLALAGENQAPLRVLGRIDEVFGAVSQPCYVVRLTAAQCRPAQAAVSQPAAEAAPGTAEEEVAAAVAVVAEEGVQREHTLAHMDDISPGDAVVSIVEYSATVNPALCRVAPATDASNRYDEEASDAEFSDDEAEAAARRHFKQGDLALEPVDSVASTKDTAQTAQLQRDPKAASIKAACARSPLPRVTAHAFHLALKHIAGAQDAKAALQHTLLLPLLLPPEWLRGARQAPTALLLTGPPGTGKSSLMQAAAEAVGAACIFLSPSDVLSRYTGGSEGSLSRAFAHARAAAATSSCSVLCIDELDSIAPRRSACDAVAPARLVCQLLLELDTLAAAVGQQGGHRTVLLAATNRPEAIDPAVLRRMRVAAVPLPDTDQRASIVTASLQAGNTPHCITPEHARALATATQGCSGADVAAMVRYAAWLPLQEALASAAPGSGPTDSGDGEWPIEPPPVLPRHLTAAQTWFRTSQQAQGAVLNQAATVPRQAERDALSHSTEGAPNAACTAPCT